jgi:hypothetical protein
MSGTEKQSRQAWKEIVVRRDGQRDLVFTGRLLAKESSHRDVGDESKRWDEYTVYETKGGNHVLEHVYHTQRQGERNAYEAWVGVDLAALLDAAAYTDPDDAEGKRKIYPSVLKRLAEACGVQLHETIE